ncbi:MAG: hypothetical protein JRG73_06675 [Deltaproteobacteria bacterium]|nr:hypothetical protein [Deltaproteobacteria bacterium]MBW2306607.1 hypothetical protein [Deltaproteobacteria bacterium]
MKGKAFVFWVCFMLLGFVVIHRADAVGEHQGAVKFKTFRYIDQQGIGMEAFSMLIPADWRFQGGIQWRMDNPAMPAVGAFRVTSPVGTEELELLPSQMFFWTNNPMILSNFPIGSRYFGAEVRPPAESLNDLFTGILIPRFRGNEMDLRVHKVKPLPDLARQLRAGRQAAPEGTSQSDAGKVRIEYRKNTRRIEEEMFAVIEANAFSIPSMMGRIINVNWMADYLFSFKAEKGKLDAHAKTFQTMLNSFKIHPQWFNKYTQLTEYLIRAQIQQIQNIGQVSRIISQTSNEISDMIMDSYQQRQAVYDRISTNFSRAIRGVDAYTDPNSGTVELPGGYTHAWTNNLGEYVLSDDPNFDPNIGSQQNWELMRRNP